MTVTAPSPPRWRIFAGRVLFVAAVAIGCYYIGRYAQPRERPAADKPTELSTLQGQLTDALQNQIKRIDGQLQAVSKQQQPPEQAAQINNLQMQIRNVQTNLSGLHGQLSGLQKQLEKISQSNQSETIAKLTADLKAAQDKIREMMPSPGNPNTYNIKTNQSLIVEDGRLQIGLVGSPRQESVVLNLNGEQKLVATGDIINTALDSSTNCRISVISIDILNATAVVYATCAAKKS